MDNAEEIMHSLEEFSKLKPKDIPRELEDYLGYVAKTGDPVFKWSIIKCLFREKLLNVITDFYESTLSIELPPCPNVDPFNYERMKANLLEKLDSFNGAPFTVQRISELLTNPWKEYNRADKFMRAIEKNILVVSTREPGRYADNEVDTQQDSSFNGIPGSNDSGIESSFTCNDIADRGSSSHNFDANQESQTLITGVTSNNITSVSFKENAGDIGDSACSNELGLIRNDEVSQEIIIEEKDTETVICSTISEQPSESGEQPSESSLPLGENKATDLSMDTDCSLESSGDSNVSSNEVGDESKEASVEVSGTEAIDSLQADENKSSTVPENNDSSDNSEIVSNSQDNSTGGSECSASAVFEESRPTECDTSNSLDSETSNSCDSELEVKQPVDELLSSDMDCKVDSSGVNEAASTSNYSVSETTKTEESAEDSNPSTSTSCEPSEMDVGECQISHVDQSQS